MSKKTRKYNIVRGDIERDEITYIQQVEGESFVIPGWENLEFFKRLEDGFIIISEVSTGRQCGETYKSDNEARNDVKARFDRKAHKLVKEWAGKFLIPTQAVILEE